ncbi:conjugal transfer protein TraH [uncultured Photobacterium sp.]|uniref:conjugal transfer protein TraH n=1 Tax=uncultured Photobacterium sp. TaxID=173973 RepID=UPI002608E91A|nr:conjugal transfer protein TraH [uncultured Photobacterium sp.]
MTIRKYLFSGLLVAFSAFAHAESPMEKIFNGYSTGHAATSFETQKRNGFSGGAFSYRQRYITENLVSFKPPSIKSGCSGIDIHLGSFSIVKDIAGQLQNSMRQIAAGAASYAFNLALDALCSTCASNMQKLKDTMDKWNKFFKEGCELGERLMATAIGPEAEAKARNADLFGSAAATGLVDGFDSWTEKITGWDVTRVEAEVNGNTEGLEGNLLFQAFEVSGVNNWTINFNGGDWTYKELLMSLVGTQIKKDTGTTETAANGEESTSIAYVAISPVITFNELFIERTKTNNTVNNLKFLRCNDTDCLNPTEVDKSTWLPLAEIIKKIIMPPGGQPDMLQRYRYKLDFSSEQVNLINSSPLDLYLIIQGLGKMKSEGLAGEQGFGARIANSTALSYAESFYLDCLKVLDFMAASPAVKEHQPIETWINEAKDRLKSQFNESKEELSKSDADVLLDAINQAKQFRDALALGGNQ